jgi:formate dehydrogenase
MAPEITTPGDGQMRALIVSAGNPVSSVPDGRALERSFESLDLLVSIDLYVNETGQHADYVLPAATWLERGDAPVAFMPFFVKPFAQWTEPVLSPRGEARPEWEVIDDLSRRVGVAPYSVPPLRWLARLGMRISPDRLLDLMLRSGPRRLSLSSLRKHPHGMLLDEHHETGVLGAAPNLTPPEIVREISSLAADPSPDPSLPLRLIGMRELRSHNSWMHNVEKLMRAREGQVLRMNPADASPRSLADGDPVEIVSASGAVTGVPVMVTDEMRPGVVALPHGWGHRGGWKRANAAGGVNVNDLASAAPDSLERLAGMSKLNGIPVEVRAATPAEREAAAAAAAPATR